MITFVVAISFSMDWTMSSSVLSASSSVSIENSVVCGGGAKSDYGVLDDEMVVSIRYEIK